MRAERMGLTPDWIIEVGSNKQSLDPRPSCSHDAVSNIVECRAAIHVWSPQSPSFWRRLMHMQAGAYGVFGLQRPTPAQPYIAGLLDPCTNSRTAPNIPAEKLYDRQACLI